MNSSLDGRIQSHPFFQGMKAQHLAHLGYGAKESSYEAGEILFHEGEPANRMFLVQSGAVALEVHEPNDGTAVVETVREGGVIGWSWLLPPFRWHLGARVVEPTKVIVLDGAHLLATAEQRHDFGYELMKRVAQIVVRRLESTRKELLHLEGEAAVKG